MYNIDPKLWGPSLWKFSHYYTLAYPDKPTEEDINNTRNFFSNLYKYLPCEKCRYNYQQHLLKTPLTNKVLQSRTNLVLWLLNLHNQVNIMTGKKEITYDEFENIYINKDEKPKKKLTFIYILICIVILLVIINKVI